MSKFRVISLDGSGLPIANVLQDEGHTVDAYIQKDDATDEIKTYKELFDGIVDKVKLWDEGLTKDTIIIMDSVGQKVHWNQKEADKQAKLKHENLDEFLDLKNIADYLREKGHKVVSGGMVADYFELDREFGQEIAEMAGFQCPKSVEVTNYDQAIKIVKDTQKRYILKPCGNGHSFSLYPSRDYKDMLLYLNYLKDKDAPINKILLQEYIEGFQMSCEGWWNGKKLVGMNCYDDKTEVLTDNGWKFFKDLKKEDFIASLNPENNNLEYHKPLNYFCDDYKGLMYKYKGNKRKSIDFCVTPNHKFYAADHWYSPNYHLQTLDSLKNKSWRIPRKAVWKGEEKDFFILPRYEKKWKNSKRIFICPELRIKMDDWLAFLGIYLLEGSWQNNCIFIAQTARVEEVRKILEKLPFHFKYYFYPKYNNGTFILYNTQLVDYVKQFGKCKDKFIPKEFKQLSSRQIKIIFDALMVGDGHKNGKQFINSCKRLMDDVQELLLKMNQFGTIRKSTNEKGQYWYHIWRNSLDATINKRNLYQEEYEGKIYCVEVPHHIIYVRRSDMPMWCGQSTFEHKSLMGKDIGPLTGECGSVIFYYENENNKLCKLIKKLEPILEELHYPVGPIDCNFLHNEKGSWFLEYTSRAGYPSTHIQLYACQNWGEIFEKLVDGKFEGFKDYLRKDKWFIGSRVWIPEWPFEKTLPDLVENPTMFSHITSKHLDHISLTDAKVKNGQLVTGGTDGELLCITDSGNTIKEAKDKLIKMIEEFIVYPMCYRFDVGDEIEIDSFRKWGFWLPLN
jgi:phosphoribosylamine-glycine ligase